MRWLAILLVIVSACKSSTDVNVTSPNGVHSAHYVLAGTSDSAAVYFTSNEGVTWQRATIDLTGGTKVWGFATSGSETYCSSPGAGVFISNDSGKTWTKLQYPGTAAQAMTVVNSELFVADNNDGLYVSDDHGMTWDSRSYQLAGSYVHQFVNSGSTLIACTERRGIPISSNGGYSWNASDTNQTGVKDVHALAVNDRGVFAGASLTYLLLSSNQGLSWAGVSLNNISQNVWALLASDSMMYAGTSQGVLRSNTSGMNWSQFAATLASEDVHTLAFDGVNLYAGTNGDGVFRSGDKGFTWGAANSGLGNRTISAMIVR